MAEAKRRGRPPGSKNKKPHPYPAFEYLVAEVAYTQMIGRIIELEGLLVQLRDRGFLACKEDPSCGKCTGCRAQRAIACGNRVYKGVHPAHLPSIILSQGRG